MPDSDQPPVTREPQGLLPHVPEPWCPELPKLGGQLGDQAEDFEVEEVPLYVPSGEGPHRYLWVEKKNHNTRDVIRLIAREARVPDSEIGSAGLKDRHAVTRQWLSVPESATKTEQWQLPAEIKILTESRHTNKLRTGHLLANRFWLRLVGAHADWEARFPALSAELSQRGFYNYFGAQRFGYGGQNLARALEWMRRGARGHGFQPKLYASVLQSEVFNRYLSARRELGFEAPLAGEVVRLEGTGKHFRVADVAAELPRWQARDLHPTGPMPGPKMLSAEQDALTLETSHAAALGLDAPPRAFSKLAPGTRRDLFVFPQEVELTADPRGVRLAFTLPSGCYATELVSALTGEPARAPRDS